jgi:hypothetical protein
MKEYIQRNISIRIDQKEWLESHPEYSLSGIVQKALDDIIGRVEA